ncbi:hypothetical protein HELRODRAFT_125965, partial [Helobdella robusta]|uniref:SHSP domain-containing protein n=1 Tax=Helobdella robusta TaxID=6412 RepID=T1EH79_HELRO
APIVEENGETKLKLDFNVKGFKPEEVQVKIVGDNVLQVRAETGTKTDSGVSHRYYVRHYALPDGIKADQIKPTMSKEGVLSIEAPAPHLKPTERNIPI